MLEKLIFLVALAGTAVVFADVLVRDGMLLAPVQRWLREWHKRLWLWRYMRQPILAGPEPLIDNIYYQAGEDLDSRWWWPPLWGCFKCVAGQWGFWGHLIRYHQGYTWRTIPEHLAFTAFTIIAAIIIQKWTKDN